MKIHGSVIFDFFYSITYFDIGHLEYDHNNLQNQQYIHKLKSDKKILT